MIWNKNGMDSESENHVSELLKFSNEILLEIFTNFNDIDLLNTARVCRRFEAIAKETFADKYNGDSEEKYYDIKVCTKDIVDDQKLYRTFLKTFGNEIAAINITSQRGPNKYNLLKLIGEHCRSAKHITVSTFDSEFNLTQMIQSMTQLTSLSVKGIKSTNLSWANIRFPRLTTFAIDDIPDIDVEVLKQFLYINPQLERLRINYCTKFPLKVIQALRDKMKRLKSLEYTSCYNLFGDTCRDINMEQLETLKIAVDATSFRSVLVATTKGSKKIQSLEVLMRDDDVNTEGIHQQMDEVIPLFEKLTTLRLVKFDLTVDVTRYLIRFLPHLVTLKLDGIRLSDFHSYDILFIFKKCKHMKELSMESDSHSIKTEEFNLGFHREFIEITRNRGSGVKFEVIQPETKMTITAEKIINNDQLIYWNVGTECEAPNSCSNVHFLDLNDKCLSRIYSYLDEQSERALYETCTRTKEAMHERITKQVFTVVDLNSARDTFKRFGDHITKLAIDISKKNGAQTAAVWTFIGTEFAEKITELSLVNVKVSAVDSFKVKFPNVTTLKIMSVVTSRTHIFPPMDCPKLSRLEFHKDEITFATKASNFGVSLDHLTTIKLVAASKVIRKILHLLDDRICDQIQEFSVDPQQHIPEDNPYKLFSNVAMRFRNLTTLNFCVPDIEETNTKYLFESCTKIVKLTMGCSYYDINNNNWRRTIKNIKENCKHLEVIQMISNYFQFDNELLSEIAEAFPKAQFNIVVYNCDNNTYRVEAYKKLTKDDRIKPF
ncbi:uncharacterized protein LOC129566472 [Sitodiplosis mosellana]|uniref:uncharacterized protein LOC129566472 n=1 Tax=Sitodiplosis mosellana TaxID=263140 RepID=UPI0024440DA1|nr:uncharacterized protein LOC129566472 [Sitodiplosis mosellana]